MANTATKAEREELIAICTERLAAGAYPRTLIRDLSSNFISRDRVRYAIAKAQRRLRGEEIRQRDQVRRGVSLDLESLDQIARIEAATGINGASAVIREALRRWAAEL